MLVTLLVTCHLYFIVAVFGTVVTLQQYLVLAVLCRGVADCGCDTSAVLSICQVSSVLLVTCFTVDDTTTVLGTCQIHGTWYLQFCAGVLRTAAVTNDKESRTAHPNLSIIIIILTLIMKIMKDAESHDYYDFGVLSMLTNYSKDENQSFGLNAVNDDDEGSRIGDVATVPGNTPES